MGVVSCFSQRNQNVVCENVIDDGIKTLTTYEYFVSNGVDTMAISFIFTKVKEKRIINIDIQSYVDTKLFMMLKDDDTMAIDTFTTTQKKTFKHPHYAEFLSELKLCIEKATERFDISQLHHISLCITDIPEIAIAVSKGSENVELSHKSIDMALKETSIERDINNILEDYNLVIDNVHSYEEIIEIEALPYYRLHNLKETNMPSRIVGTHLLFIIREFP